MKIKTLLLAIILAVSFGVVLPRQAEARVTFSYFYDSLQPFGEWVDVDNYGYCWQPRGLDRDWRPYTDGYWSYTDAGWTWVSYEDFGSIVYHYGRWIRLEDYGWVWKPDYEWGPAWVSWRQSDDYIGWAPLPPDAVFEPDTGIGVWVDRDYDIGPSAYAFCEYRYFGAPVIRNFLVPRHRNFAIINSTVNITNITVVTGADRQRIVFNGGLDYRRISGRTEHRIETLQLVRQRDGDWAQQHRPELSRKIGSQLFVIAPEVEAPRTRIAPARVSQQISAPRIDRGWAGVADTAEKDRIKARYHDQTLGLTRTTAPAYTVNAVQAQTILNDAREHQKQAPQHQQAPQTQQPQIPAAQSRPTPQVQPLSPVQPNQPTGRSAATPMGAPVVDPSIHGQRNHTRPTEQTPTQTPEQTQRVQQQAEQQRKAADVQARAAREQEQSQRIQQQAEQQRKAADVQARAAREQEQSQRVQQQAEQQRKAADVQARAAREQQEQQVQRAQQEAQQRRQQQEQRPQRQQPQVQPQTTQAPQAQAQQSPSPDGKKRHKDRED